MIQLIIEALIALPKIIGLFKELFSSIKKMKDESNSKEISEGLKNGDNIKVEKAMGHSSPGAPSGLPGAELRDIPPEN